VHEFAELLGGTWRDQLLAYNANPGNNPLGLLLAFELYENDIYRAPPSPGAALRKGERFNNEHDPP
jgi:hypothetical protein